MRASMPRGTALKFKDFGSNLRHPDGAFLLKYYRAEHGLPDACSRLPVLLKTFSDYGVGLQKRLVPMPDKRWVTTTGAR
jgi:hypothetical protein